MVRAERPSLQRRRATKTTGSERSDALDPFTAEVIRSYFLSIMQDMVLTTTRTAYSTCFSEQVDFTCGLFDARGRMIAQALGIPGHAGALVDTVEAILRAYDAFEDGDVIVFNDPYNGANHQADVVVARPIFVEGTMLGLSVNRGHWTDVGGMSPGGWSGTVRDVIQEGLIIPPAKLYRAGVLNREIKDFILKNVRVPKQCWGDLQAQIASNVVAERRMRSLVERYGLQTVLDGMEETLRYSRRRFARMLDQLPDGECHGEEVIDDDGHGGGPYRIKVTVIKRGHSVVVDFAGTDPQVMGPVNLSLSATRSGAFVAVMAVVDSYIDMNSGVLDFIEVKVPAGCLLNPAYPAPVYSWADPCIKTIEAILRAMSQIAGDRVPAGSLGTGNNLTGSGTMPHGGGEFLWYIVEPGGGGARPTKDGNDVVWPLFSNGRTEPMEVWEARYPVRFEKYELVTDSGGPGLYRGGVGESRQIRVLLPTFISAVADRQKFPPWGLNGGQPGLPNRFTVIRDGKAWDLPTLFGISSPSKFSELPLKALDILEIREGGGGGYGDPLNRQPEAVAADVLNGLVSVEQARKAYGVSVNDAGEIDRLETDRMRQELRSISLRP